MSGLEVTMMKRIGELNDEVKSLQAEVKRLAADTLKDLSLVEELKAENERLRKAGDWVMSHWSSGDGSDQVRFCQALLKWNAAKEGRPNE